jgi:hypothetical protein
MWGLRVRLLPDTQREAVQAVIDDGVKMMKKGLE